MPYGTTGKDSGNLTDPKLVITKDTWNELTHDQKLQITYDTTISTRDTIIELSKKVDILVNKPANPCEKMETRIEKLEKWSKLKAVATIFSGFVSGFGGSHLSK